VKRTISVHTPTSFEEQALLLPPHSLTLLLRLATEDSEGMPIEYAVGESSGPREFPDLAFDDVAPFTTPAFASSRSHLSALGMDRYISA